MKPWDQLPDETSKNYGAFVVFLDMEPASRSIMSVAIAICETNRMLGTTPDNPNAYRHTLSKWSAKYKWYDRARKYDTYNLNERVKNRPIQIEQGKQKIVDNIPEYIKTLHEQATGKLPASPMVRYCAAKTLLQMGGVVEVKRGDVVTDIDNPIQEQATKKLSDLGLNGLLQLREAIVTIKQRELTYDKDETAKVE